jgi:CRISPR-associated protein Cmr4
MKTELYKIETLSNLHVGSGDINFDVIDNQVQRDAITTLPNINSSSLKGAFREAFEKEGTKALVEYIFGPENTSNDSHRTGAYSFFEAQLLSRPVRSNAKAYFSATSPMAIKTFLETIENFSIEFDTQLKEILEKFSKLQPKKDTPFIFEKGMNVILEDEKAFYNEFDTSKLQSLLGTDIALFNDEDFKSLDLPVLSRNALDEDGISTNLWYEEVVPKKSVFFFVLAKPTNIADADAKKIAGLQNRFEEESMRLQIGANKSIGYGFCKVERVSK